MGIIFWSTAGGQAAASPGALNGGIASPVFSQEGDDKSDYSPDPWDTVWLGGKQLPGLCKVQGMPTLKIDQKKKGGADSIRFTATGYLPGPINVEFMIWTSRHWVITQEIRPFIWKLPNKQRSKGDELALPIKHPALALWNINTVIVQGVSTPKPGPLPQSFVIEIRCLEFVPDGRGNQTKTAKSTSFQRDGRIPNLNKAEKPSDNPPGPNG